MQNFTYNLVMYMQFYVYEWVYVYVMCVYGMCACMHGVYMHVSLYVVGVCLCGVCMCMCAFVLWDR